jgi:hypothetical protein
MNADEKRMSEWLAHPNEFGEPPAEIKEIHRELTCRASSWQEASNQLQGHSRSRGILQVRAQCHRPRAL